MKQTRPVVSGGPILVGYRATGKTTVARELAHRFGWESVDADDAFEDQHRETIAGFLATHGEKAFRERESLLLGSLLQRINTVLATGGGVVLRDENRHCLKQSTRPVIWLTATIEEIRRRLAADPATADRRPALEGGDVLDEVSAAVEARAPLYKEVADISFDTSAEPLPEVVEKIAVWLGEQADVDVSRIKPPAGGRP